MAAISNGFKLAWQVAASEAVQSQHQFIETGHLYIGVCSLEKFVGQLADSIQEDVTAEAAAIASTLQELRLSPQVMRREIRRRLGKGDYARPEGQRVSRSLAVKAAFVRAGNLISNKSDVITSLYLLGALFHDERGIVATFLREKGVNLREAEQRALAAAAQISPRSAETRPGSTIVEQRQSTLEKIGKDLTAMVLDGKIGECIGREEEILRIVQVLSRETKNNPLLIGDPGVGKTAIVEGLAWRLAHNKDPAMEGRRLIQINLAGLMAGTKYRGELEERIDRLIDETARSPNTILFVDEIDTIANAQGAQGALDIANLLKPALARGQLRCIGATTWEGYSQYIEKDPALERRFQPVYVEEPSLDEAVQILEAAYRKRLSVKHRVTIEATALRAAVLLSMRYLPDRRLPDKAIDLLDEACARVGLPRLGTALPDPPNRAVTAEIVTQVLADWTKLPIAALTGADRERLLGMANALRRHVIGQDDACQKVAQMVQRAHAGLKHPERPVAVLLFVGPTGVGKTELAKATAEFLFGDPSALIRLDMSEYMEKHSVSRLIGAPPGFIGYDSEPQLTGALRRRPYSVVLIDEVEKAHPDVLNLFLQLFDEGRLTDSRGRTASGANAIFILTSNVADGRGRVGFIEEEKADQELLISVRAAFRPEVWNRFDAVIPFRKLKREDLKKIAWLLLDPLKKQLKEKGIILQVRDEAIEFLAGAGDDRISGARALRREIEQEMESGISNMLLAERLVSGDGLVVCIQNGRLTFKIDSGATGD
jgi:ATP-dependent Clp protease ATP-binding subunit ClpC